MEIHNYSNKFNHPAHVWGFRGNRAMFEKQNTHTKKEENQIIDQHLHADLIKKNGTCLGLRMR